MIDVFEALGTPPDDARICADVLIESDLRGIQSHGVGRLKYYYDRIQMGLHQTETEMEIVKETETTAVIDGHHGMGHVIAYHAMRTGHGQGQEIRPGGGGRSQRHPLWHRRLLPIDGRQGGHDRALA